MITWAGGFLKSQCKHFNGVFFRPFIEFYLLVFMKKGGFDGSGDTPYLDSKTEDLMVDCFFVLGRLDAGFNT